MKKQAILGLLVSIMSLTAFAERVRMVDVPMDEDIVAVDGKQQVVTIKGPSDLNTQAILLKSVVDENNEVIRPAAIQIIGSDKNSGQTYSLALNSDLSLGVLDDVLYGQESTLSVNKTGSLVITLQNTAIGRDRYASEIVVAYRNGSFVVAGFKHKSYDTLDPEIGESCDFNLLTGQGIKDGKRVKLAKKTILFENLKDSEKLYSCSGL